MPTNHDALFQQACRYARDRPLGIHFVGHPFRWASTSRSRASGRTWSAAAAPSGSTSTRGRSGTSARPFPAYRSTHCTSPSTRSGRRSFASRPMRRPTTCTSWCGSSWSRRCWRTCAGSCCLCTAPHGRVRVKPCALR